MDIGLHRVLIEIVKLVAGLGDRIRERKRANAAERANRSRHFSEQTIAKSVRNYVCPDFTDKDPGESHEPISQGFVARQNAIEVITAVIKKKGRPGRPHALILADSGMGKTSLLLNAASFIASRNDERTGAALVALGARDADEVISAIQAKPKVVILLDGLDEDSLAIGRPVERLNELIEKCRDFKAVIVSCRTQFFDNAAAIPRFAELRAFGPVPAGQNGLVQIDHLYLAPFNDTQIDEYLRRRYGFFAFRKRHQARAFVDSVPALSVRPMLLSYLPELIELDTTPKTASAVYRLVFDAWLRRERQWIQELDLGEFSYRCALDIFARRIERGGESAGADELEFLSITERGALSRYQVTSRSLLNRTADGKYKFSHRSIMEFLVVDGLTNRISNQWSGQPIELTDQMRRFLFEELNIESGHAATDFQKINLCQVPALRITSFGFDWKVYNYAGRVTNPGLWRLPLSHGDRSVTRLGDLFEVASNVASSKKLGLIRVIMLRVGGSTNGVTDLIECVPFFVCDNGLVWGNCATPRSELPDGTHLLYQLDVSTGDDRAGNLNYGYRLERYGGKFANKGDLSELSNLLDEQKGVGASAFGGELGFVVCPEVRIASDSRSRIGLLLPPHREFQEVDLFRAIWWSKH